MTIELMDRDTQIVSFLNKKELEELMEKHPDDFFEKFQPMALEL